MPAVHNRPLPDIEQFNIHQINSESGAEDEMGRCCAIETHSAASPRPSSADGSRFTDLTTGRIAGVLGNAMDKA